MTETKSQRIARSYVAGAVSLLDQFQHPYGSPTMPEDLEAAAALLELARKTLDGGVVKREKIAERTRERFSKPKPKSRTRKKRPTPGAFAAPRAAADVD